MTDVLSQDNDVLSSFFSPSSPMMTTPPSESPPAAAAPNLQPQIDALRRRSDAAIGGVEQTMAEEEQTAAAKEKAMEPLRQRQMALTERNLKQLEQQPPKAQQPPPTPQRQNQHDDENWLFAASLLGALAGGLTRRHMTNALGAFSGAMEGYQEGSRQKFDQNLKIWEAENKKIQETNKAAMDEYRSVLENTKLSQDQMSIALQLAAAKYDDKAMAESAKTKNFFQIAQHYDKEAQALEQLDRSHKSLSESRAAATAREQEQQAIQFVASNRPMVDAILRYERPPPPVNPRGGLQGAVDRAVTAAIYAENPNFEFGKWARDNAEKKQAQLIPGRVKAAQEMAGARTSGTAAANIQLVMRAVGPVIENAAEKAQKVPATAFPGLNKLLQTASEAIGDPALRDFQIANLELAEQLARAMNPRSSVIAVATMNRAIEFLSTADSPEAYDRVLRNIDRFAEREFQVTQDQLAGKPIAPVHIPDSTQRRLEPTPRQLLPKAGGGGTLQNTPLGHVPVPGASLTGQARAAAPVQYPTSPTPDMPLPEGWSVKELQ